MKKKATKSSSSTIIRTGEKQQQQQQLSCLMKVLKPKVYITDISHFKRLVQELTGNDSNGTNNSNTSSMISSPMIMSPLITNTTNKESEIRKQQLLNGESLCPLGDQATTMNQFISNQEYKHGLGQCDRYRDFETWFLDIDSIPAVPLCDSYGGIVEQDIDFCNYDYDLSRLL